jgi:hypothetical protein
MWQCSHHNHNQKWHISAPPTPPFLFHYGYLKIFLNNGCLGKRQYAFKVRAGYQVCVKIDMGQGIVYALRARMDCHNRCRGHACRVNRDPRGHYHGDCHRQYWSTSFYKGETKCTDPNKEALPFQTYKTEIGRTEENKCQKKRIFDTFISFKLTRYDRPPPPNKEVAEKRATKKFCDPKWRPDPTAKDCTKGGNCSSRL